MKYGRTEADVPAVNVEDAALIFEGGGMRASYTSGVVGALIENDISFGNVYGISAGSSNTANYVSRDVPRAYHSFTKHVVDPRAVSRIGLLNGKGYFNSPYLYEGIGEELDGTDEPMAFDWEMFAANPADVHIEAFDWDTGETVAFTKADMPTMRDMMLQVRASSTMPLMMPPTTIDGRTYMDGGLGSSWGIALDAARRDGFERFFIVRTQPKGYRKKPISPLVSAVFKTAFRKHPLVAENTIARPDRYNEICDDIEELERSGAAYVFYPEHMEVSNSTTDIQRLDASLRQGIDQSSRELDAWRKWLGL